MARAVARAPRCRETVTLIPLELRVDAEHGDLGAAVFGVRVDAHHTLVAALERFLEFVARTLDFALRVTLIDGRNHPPTPVNFVDELLCLRFELVSELFDEVAPTEGIDRMRHAGFFQDHLLRAQREPR